MGNCRSIIIHVGLFVLFVGGSRVIAQNQIDIWSGMDNTLYEDAAGALSNGKGEHFFAGRVAPRQMGQIRRGLIYFDIAVNIPSGATIQSVELRLNMSRAISGDQPVSIHRVLADWGEGISDAVYEEGGGAWSTTGDATWLHRNYPTIQWANPGGDFSNVVGATQTVGGVGAYIWGSTSEMAADVQAWLDDPIENFGWIVIGNEAEQTTAKRFDTWENVNAQNHPKLTVTYSDASCIDECEVTGIQPDGFLVEPNYPNPFNPRTTIRYWLPEATQVKVTVYDASGRQVRTLIDGFQESGYQFARWSGLDDAGHPAASGFYFGVVRAGQQIERIKMTLLQ